MHVAIIDDSILQFMTKPYKINPTRDADIECLKKKGLVLATLGLGKTHETYETKKKIESLQGFSTAQPLDYNKYTVQNF